MYDIILMVRIVLALVGTAIGAWYDVRNKKNVPDAFLYMFLGIALVINLFDPSEFISRAPIALLVLAVLYVMYRFGQIGGADILILAAIYSAVPAITSPLLSSPQIDESILPIHLPSILSLFAVAVFIFSVVMVVKYLPLAVRKTVAGKTKIGKSAIAQVAALIIAYAALIVTTSNALGSIISINYYVFVGVVLFIVAFLVLYKDMIMESMIKTRAVESEDILALERIDKKTIDKYKLERLVTEEQLGRMKKLKSRWPVFELPVFIPYLLIALIAYVLFGDPLLYHF